MSAQNSEAKHTPGPWVHEGRGGATGRFCITTDHDNPAFGREMHLACVSKPRGMTDATHRANARLIAAAPELLAQMRNVEDVASKNAEHGSADWAFVRDTARAAIAKAQGGAA